MNKVVQHVGESYSILMSNHTTLFCRHSTNGVSMIEANRDTICLTLERIFDIRPAQAEKLFTEVIQCMRKRDLVSLAHCVNRVIMELLTCF